jgi:hypothetical protein
MPFISPKKRVSRKYRYVLHESNLKSEFIGDPVRDLRKAKGRGFTITLNRGGNLQFTNPLDDPSSIDIIGHEIRRCVVVLLKDSDADEEVIVGSWPIMNVSASTESGQMTVQCVGWQELLGNREVMRQAIYADLFPGDIVRRLLDSTSTQILDESVDIFAGRGLFESDYDWVGAPSIAKPVTAPAASYALPVLSNEWSKSGSKSVKVKVLSGWPSTATYGVIVAGTGQTPGAGWNTTNLAQFTNLIPIDPSTGVPYTDLTCSFYSKTIDFRNAVVLMFFQCYDASGQHTQDISVDISARLPTNGNEGKVTQDISVPSGTVRVSASVGLYYIASSNGAWVGYLDAFRMYQSTDEARAKAEEMVLPFEYQTGIDLVGGPVKRTRTMSVGQKLDSAIQELSDIESGFDYKISTEKVIIAGDPQQKTLLRRRFILKRDLIKVGTTLFGIGQDRPNVVFGHKWGPRNVMDISPTNDGSKMANRIIVKDSNGRSFIAQDFDSISEYGLFQDTITISDAGYSDTILMAYAQAELAYRRVPFTTYSVKPKSFMGRRNVPRLFRDYNVGDICYIVSREKNLPIGVDTKQAIRIFGVTVALDNEGNETVNTLQTAAGS